MSTVAATAVILGCGLVTGLIAARSLGPAGRGELAAIVVWTNVLLYAGTIGLPEAVAYFAAADRSARIRIWTTGQAGALVLGAVVTVLGWWIIRIVMFASPERADAMCWFLVFFAVPCLGSLCAGSWLQGSGFVHRFNISRSSVHVVNAAGMAALAAAAHTGRILAAALRSVRGGCWPVCDRSVGQLFARQPRAIGAPARYGLRKQGAEGPTRQPFGASSTSMFPLPQPWSVRVAALRPSVDGYCGSHRSWRREWSTHHEEPRAKQRHGTAACSGRPRLRSGGRQPSISCAASAALAAAVTLPLARACDNRAEQNLINRRIRA